VSATIAQEMPSKVRPFPAEDPFDVVGTATDGIVPIPMPPLTHPGGEQVHPWTD
jgi:hypothetical protein